jgi:hypothetical protein
MLRFEELGHKLAVVGRGQHVAERRCKGCADACIRLALPRLDERVQIGAAMRRGDPDSGAGSSASSCASSGDSGGSAATLRMR